MTHRFILNETSYHGKGSVKILSDEIRKRGYKKCFICTDPDIMKRGVAKKVVDVLDNNQIAYETFCKVKANPSVENVLDGVEEFKKNECDCIIAVGGGSSIDTAKAIGIIVNNPEFADVVSLEGEAPTKNPSVPIIAVPTTAGTAAEVTIYYVITDEKNGKKMVCVDVHCIPVVAIVDPDMMASMPTNLTAATGMDALTHAIEGYTTKSAWVLSDMYNLKAIEIIGASLRGAVDGNPTDISNMALGQYIAGMGFSNSGLGIVHSMAHPLGAIYNMPHGVANAIILPVVMEYNAPETEEKFRDIAKALGVKGVGDLPLVTVREEAVGAVRKLSKDIGIPTDLKGTVKASDLTFLAESAYKDACRPGNPKDTNAYDIKKLYESLI